MGRIRILADAVAHQIAAGEVVERPASVIKELIENSLDAGARHIEVEAAGAGKRRLLVADDGEGMDRDDALLAFEKHATSKISSAQDLLAIRSFGFRGEALGSIAAVSRVELLTRRASSAEATQVRIAGGRLLGVEAAGGPVGTRIEVRDLFYNTPARRRFLRSDSTELSHLIQTVARLGWIESKTSLRLDHEQRTLLDLPAGEPLRRRAQRLLGDALASELLELEIQLGGGRAHGLISRAGVSRRTRGELYLFVNRRPVTDRILLHALAEGYRGHLPDGGHPAVVLFVELPPEEVDVNVHPAKSEVRFRRGHELHDRIRSAIRERLARRLAGSSFGSSAALPAAAIRPLSGAVGEALALYAPAGVEPAPADARLPELASLLVRIDPAAAAVTLPEDLLLLGQYRQTYILAADRDGLLIVDQHVAHERILFERLLATAARSQPLLIPKLVELRPAQRPRRAELLEGLGQAGLEVEPFGGEALLVRALPPGLESLDPLEAIDEFLAEPGAGSCGGFAGELRARAAAALACRGAVKANQALAVEQMRGLLVDLRSCAEPMHCPHGRPIVLRLSHAALERAFGRTK